MEETLTSDPHGAEASWQYWEQSTVGRTSSETSPGSFTAKEKNGKSHYSCI